MLRFLLIVLFVVIFLILSIPYSALISISITVIGMTRLSISEDANASASICTTDDGRMTVWAFAPENALEAIALVPFGTM